jgi:hypothetical protein
MTDSTISVKRQEAFVNEMVGLAGRLAGQLSEWAQTEPRTLLDMEQASLQMLHELGRDLLAGLCQLAAPTYPVAQVACACGQRASYQRLRTAHVPTLLGQIALERPYYVCPACHHGLAPLDQALGFAAGSLSPGLAELLALLGAQFTFEEAAALTAKLTLITVCPNSVAQETEALGRTIAAAEASQVAQAWSAHPQLPPPATETPPRLYVSMDGVIVHTRQAGWKEVKLGAVYTTKTVAPKQRPDQLEVRAQTLSFYADLADYETFGRGLWLEAYRRGVTQAQEVVVIGDGALWIWKLVEEHWPQAIQIVDWYHASEYIWHAAHAIYGEGTDLAKQWAHDRLDELWEGHFNTVMAQFQAHAKHAAVQDAITYYTNNEKRMRYPDYRAKGLQIGSGSIESGCKHVIAARLKQAGMIWNIEGARAVAKVRSRWRSHRWSETIALRPPPHRSYQRKAPA